MNVKLKWQSEFTANRVIDDVIEPKNYCIKLNLLTLTENNHYNNVAFDRIKAFIENICEGSTFVDTDSELVETLENLTPDRLIHLPNEEAYDQIIGIALFCKLNAIMESAMSIESIEISSKPEQISYCYDKGDALGPFEKKNDQAWWHKSDLSIQDNQELDYTWESLGLSWEEPSDDDDSTEIVLELEKVVTPAVKTSKSKFDPKILVKEADED